MGFQSDSQSTQGSWIDRGLFDASGNPGFPAATRGDLYTISAAGLIGDSDARPGLKVEQGDLIYCLQDNPGGLSATVGSSWNALQSNVDTDRIDFNNPIIGLPIN